MNKIIALLGSVLLLVALASIALAHAEIDTCTPPINGTVETAPDKVTCKTTEGMDPKGSSLSVFDAAGMQVDKGDSAVDLNDPDRKTISVSLDMAMMKDGVYTVKWKTLSADDGDAADGSFTFTVGEAMQMDMTATPPSGATSAPQAATPEVTHPNGDESIGVATIGGKQITLTITAPPKDATLPAGDVRVEATVQGITLGDNGTHLHFYVDDKLATMGEGAQTSATVKLDPGTHELMVALADTQHDSLIDAHVHVTVQGATTPAATAAAATPEAVPTVAPTSASSTTSPTATPTAAATLPTTGEDMNVGLFALLALAGFGLLGAGALATRRGR
ncbi:MAG TPA: copper resistance protein CopC [Anaerolineae bacterium]|nr:copper resistance protein CopC [Anaerolineae bacterium]